MTDELRMNAYYYGFEPTGVLAIDKILSAVACAGKSYHHTESWCDEPYGRPGEPSECDKIQAAANEAAKELVQTGQSS